MAEANCCRSMVSIPNVRTSMMNWIQHLEYTQVGTAPYPCKHLNHDIVKDNVELVLFVKMICSTSTYPENKLEHSVSNQDGRMHLSPIWRMNT